MAEPIMAGIAGQRRVNRVQRVQHGGLNAFRADKRQFA